MVVPAQTELALVTVDVPKKVMERAPSDFADMPGMIAAALLGAFRGSPVKLVDKVSLGHMMEIEPSSAPEIEVLPGVTVQADHAPPENAIYIAKAPEGLPVGVTAPLVLGVRVLDWRLIKKEAGTKNKPRKVDNARVDVVYSLWTHDGREVETRRVKADLAFMTKFAQGVKLLPGRGPDGMYQTKEFFFGGGSMDRRRLFEQAVEINARAFAFPFAEHQIPVSAVWDDSVDSVKPGVDKADRGDLPGAIESWTEVLKTDPKCAPALFNTGVAYELQGDDETAKTKYDEALGVNARDLYRRTRKALRARIEMRQTIELPTSK